MTTARKSFAKELVRERHGREVDELLRDLYVTKRHSQAEIAEALGVGITRATVGQWLEEYGISRDDRKPVAL